VMDVSALNDICDGTYISIRRKFQVMYGLVYCDVKYLSG